MKVVSLNIGLPREIFHEGRSIRTGILKEPVNERRRVTALNVAGDQQADLTVHGGPHKALYAYPSEHYVFWRKELPKIDFTWGGFGENLTTEGLLEKDICIGDRLVVGSVELMATEPRLPCYKLAARFGRSDFVKRFLKSRRTGFYFAVLREGDIGAGDPIQYLSRDGQRMTVAEVTRLYAFDRNDVDGLRRASTITALSDNWRDYFRQRLDMALTAKQ